MRPRAQVSAAGLIIVVLIALLGFAAVSTGNSSPATDQVAPGALPASLSARVAAASFSALLNPEVAPSAPAATRSPVASSPTTPPRPAPPTTSTTTTIAPTTTAAPPSTTTTTPRSTTTTTPPTTTTTTTTTVPPTTTTTAPPTTTEPPIEGGPRDVEEWRSLVEQYFAAELVDDALAVIDCESRGDPLAENSVSGAAGLFQFIPSTWGWAAPAAGFPEASPFDPAANVATAAWLVQRSIDRGENPWAHWSCRP
ncbi:MAG: transglycosylase SLT domain-containing protein [Acidimicrobiia bacterium]|nr:transglycosylase SLT domain-containing protein [Acidimicrobiia bacterium]